MLRSISVAAAITIALSAAPAFAKTISVSEHFKAGKHEKVAERATLHTKTGVIDLHEKITKKDGKEKTVSVKLTPEKTGYSYSKTVTGFGGKTTTTGGSVGHGQTSASHGQASAGHGGGKKG